MRKVITCCILLLSILSCSSTFDEEGRYSYSYGTTKDSVSCDITLNLLVQDEYRFDRFNFELKTINHRGEERRDTLSIPLSDGERVVFIEDATIYRGDYKFTVESLMPRGVEGIKSINIRVVPKRRDGER